MKRGNNMEYKERIIEYLKENHGIVTALWCKNQGISHTYLIRIEVVDILRQ